MAAKGVLVVNDEPTTLEGICNKISRSYRVHKAQTPERAMTLAINKRPHVALVDYFLQVPDLKHMDWKNVRWPHKAMEHWVREGRSDKEALRFMTIENDPVEPWKRIDVMGDSSGFSTGLRKELDDLAKEVRLPKIADGFDLAKELLRHDRGMHVIITSADDVTTIPAWRNLRAAFPARLHFMDAGLAASPHVNDVLASILSTKKPPASR